MTDPASATEQGAPARGVEMCVFCAFVCGGCVARVRFRLLVTKRLTAASSPIPPISRSPFDIAASLGLELLQLSHDFFPVAPLPRAQRVMLPEQAPVGCQARPVRGRSPWPLHCHLPERVFFPAPLSNKLSTSGKSVSIAANRLDTDGNQWSGLNSALVARRMEARVSAVSSPFRKVVVSWDGSGSVVLKKMQHRMRGRPANEGRSGRPKKPPPLVRTSVQSFDDIRACGVRREEPVDLPEGGTTFGS